MRLLRTLITNHPLVNIAFTVVLVLGLLAYLNMPREQDPEINFNWVVVNTILPGASALDVEELVTSPLEDAIRNVQDIKFVTSSSRESASNVLVRFRDISERTFDKRLNDLRREIQNKANEELPDDAEDPIVLELTTSNGFPTAVVVLAGRADDENLRRVGAQIEKEIENLVGVDNVVTTGLHDPELQIDFDPRALANQGLHAGHLADQITGWFRDTSAGTLRSLDGSWLIRIDNADADPEALAGFKLSSVTYPGLSVPLDSVAEVQRGREKPTRLVSFEGRPAIAMLINKVSYTNTLQLVERINRFIDERNAALTHTGLQLYLADDQTDPTRTSLTIMQRNAGLGLLLVMAVCGLFLGWRIAAMVTLGIIFSIAGTFYFLQLTGNTVNQSVLLGVVIVLGMLVDDAVVVVEAIYYRLQRGVAPIASALGALSEVVKPVTSAVATTIAAFLPLMLLPGILGKFMFVIPFVVTVGLAVSLIEAYWILPSHVIGVARRFKAPDKQHWRWRRTHQLRIAYTRALIHVLRRPKRYLAIAIMAFLFAIGAVGSGQIKQEFFTFDPFRLFYIHVDMPANASLQETLQQTEKVEAVARGYLEAGEIRAVTSMAGIKFTDTEYVYGDHYGQIQIALLPRRKEMRSVASIVQEMREEVTAISGAKSISFFEISGGPPKTKPINVKVLNDDFTELRRAADAVKDIVRELPGTKDVIDNDAFGRPQLTLNLDLEAVRAAGLDAGLIARLTRLHVDGEVATFIRGENEKIELRIRAKPRSFNQVEDLLDDPIVLPNGGVTTLGALTRTSHQFGRDTIHHYNFRRAISVEADIEAGSALNETSAKAEILAAWEKRRAEFPNSDIDFSGVLDDIEESLSALLSLFLLGLGLIYLILATQFRSYFLPFLVLVTVPMAFTGVVLVLFLSGNPMSLYTLYGVVALTGIAVNAAIVMIDAANTRLRQGMRPLHATVYAARRRVVPIIMTTSTTIAGLFSLAFGLGGKSLVWGPVASSIVGGLAVSALLTLFIIPLLYRMFMHGKTGQRFADQAVLDNSSSMTGGVTG